jgi:hypothetical protein
MVIDTRNHDDPRLVKYPAGSALDNIQRVDHAWFHAHPDATDYVRELLPGEFEAGNRPHIAIGGEQIPAPPPGHQWLVRVFVLRRPIDRSIVIRVRKPFLALLNVIPMGGAI